ncbi:FHA domain-containing protein [Rhizohabitans arisaemae]|uniref:FHA domain-containing protein n=1 Tax=Rhizohabitans arisaemae TaxID=2720610 RepID=UPI0024B167AF|nr:FHA domain-containing protein [Rhizohabitans arisaemae]
MRIDEYKLSVQPGEGVVGRFPSAVMLLVSDEDIGDTGLMGLFDHPSGPPDDLDERLGELFARADTIAAFAALVETGDRTALYLHGAVEVSADDPGADLRAFGPEETPLLRYEVLDTSGALSIRYTEGGDDGRAPAALDLRGGAVPGGGFVLTPSPQPANPAANDDPMAGTAARRTTPRIVMREPAVAPATTTQPMTAHTMAAEPMTGGTADPNGVAARNAPARPRLQTPSRPRKPYIAPPPPVTAPAATQTFELPALVTAPAARPPAVPAPRPAAQPAAMAEEAAGTGGARPSYAGRLLARLLVAILPGAAWTAGLAPLLPAGFAPLSEIYTMVLVSLGVLVVLGAAIWDPVYTFAQRSRRDRDWPVAFLPLQAVPEGLLAYGVLSLLLDDFTVSQPTLIIYLATTSVVLGLGLYCLKFIPVTRRGLLRYGVRGPGPEQAAATALPPAASATSVASDNPSNAPLIWGVNCQQGHFNRPDARYCGSCGTAMHGLTREPFQAPRPVLGYLVSDDGAAHVLDGDYVVGRAPHADHKVRGGQARALITAEGDPTVADAHADVELDQWDVVVTDRGHATGTFLREQDSTSWIRLTPHETFAMQSGTRIRVGGREFVYHALNRR